MGLNDLSQFEILQGSFALIFVAISVFSGLRILYKYFTYKHKELITVSLTWIFLSSGWWGYVVNFPLVVFFNMESPEIFDITIANIFLPIALVCWIYTFTNLTYPHLTKKLSIIYTIIGIVYEIFLVYFIITNPDIVAIKENAFYIRLGIYTLTFIGFTLITAFITGILFARKSMQSDDIIIRWKGKIILIAFVFFIFGAILDGAAPLNAVLLIITRLILISSALTYYFGFLMPDKFKNWILKKQK